MSTPLTTSRGRRSPSLGAAGRFALVLSLTTSAWVLVAGFAIAVFSGQVTPNRDDVLQKEVFGFAYAFSVAGTITGAVALVTSGEWRRAVGFGTIGAILLVASVPGLRWSIDRLTAPNPVWAQREWDEAIERMGPSLSLGAAAAFVVAGMVLACGFLARRMAPWQLGIVVAIVVAILGLWVFPFTVSHLTDRVIPHLRWHYGHRYDEALRGSTTGAVPGALAGAIVTALMARWFGTSKSVGRRPA